MTGTVRGLLEDTKADQQCKASGSVADKAL